MFFVNNRVMQHVSVNGMGVEEVSKDDTARTFVKFQSLDKPQVSSLIGSEKPAPEKDDLWTSRLDIQDCSTA